MQSWRKPPMPDFTFIMPNMAKPINLGRTFCQVHLTNLKTCKQRNLDTRLMRAACWCQDFLAPRLLLQRGGQRHRRPRQQLRHLRLGAESGAGQGTGLV